MGFVFLSLSSIHRTWCILRNQIYISFFDYTVNTVFCAKRPYSSGSEPPLFSCLCNFYVLHMVPPRPNICQRNRLIILCPISIKHNIAYYMIDFNKIWVFSLLSYIPFDGSVIIYIQITHIRSSRHSFFCLE